MQIHINWGFGMKSNIYVDMLGAKDGFEDTEGISPIEWAFDKTSRQITKRLIYVLGLISL